MLDRKLCQVIEQFALYGDLVLIKRLGSGHINNSYLCTFDQGGRPVRYTLQCINERVFAHPEEVVENIVAVTTHIRRRLCEAGDQHASRHVLTLVPTRTGGWYVKDAEGQVWRVYLFIEQAQSLERVDSNLARRSGAAVGLFQQQLSDFSGTLHDTIERFHDMGLRYEAFEDAIAKDRCDRVKTVHKEIAFLREQKERGMIITRALAEGRIPLRITHNDTKINNILFDKKREEALCIIDLDTVMPGTILFDTGDLIRTAACSAAEDERDLSRVFFDTDIFLSLVEGYLSVAKTFLTQAELALIGESGRSMTQIMAVRFLTDYLKKDIYYRIERKEHNLDRARTQIALIQSMDRQWKAIMKYGLLA